MLDMKFFGTQWAGHRDTSQPVSSMGPIKLDGGAIARKRYQAKL